jgi:hypothetical protein
MNHNKRIGAVVGVLMVLLAGLSYATYRWAIGSMVLNNSYELEAGE